MIVREMINIGGKPTVVSRPVIMQCSPAQMRLALYRAGKLATVQAVADGDPEASIVWEYATSIDRNSPFIEAMKGKANMTDAEIDSLFITAMAI